MTKEVIQSHNSSVPQLHFFSSSSSSTFFSQLLGCWIWFSSSPALLFIEKAIQCRGNSPRRAACLRLKFSLSLSDLDDSLGEFRIKNLREMTILPFLLALFLDLTNNHQNLQNHGSIFHILTTILVNVQYIVTTSFKGSL